ncbi:MAG: 2-C-methyl-D-erythritol 4-phosphate cytidylyltransferase [Bacteroidota bacterium]|nr:2-C-methyl-D-erythritol 4-phosphate cytidylyltransferase [Bacteroidota bacterium]
MQKCKVGVVIPAAGIGKRLGSNKPKQFLEIDGIPILQITLQKFQACDAVDCIVVVSHADFINEVTGLVTKNDFTKITSIVNGGEHRQDSVWNGVKEIIKNDVEIILIHDAVRPFVTDEIIKNVIATSEKFGAAVPAVPLKDTIKVSDEKGFLIETLDRDKLFAVQTPQGFQKDLIVKAFEKAYTDNYYATDDANLVERLGEKIRLVEGDYKNIKITTKEDLE